MAAAQMENLMDWVSAQLAQGGGPLVVAIDGRCGSGKTTVAALLAQRLDCTVLHADDFFLRPEQRTPQRMAQPGGNFDRERFFTEYGMVRRLRYLPHNEAELNRAILMEHRYQKGWQPKRNRQAPDDPAR